jgi:uncharacterized protein YjbI with pentapeptide repeats
MLMTQSSEFEGSQEHLEILRQAAASGDSKIWNDWREKHPDITPSLRRLQMPGAILPGINLSKANLFCANLEGADLRGATLSGATLVYARFQSAQLHDAQILDANLEEAQFTDAQMPGAILRHSDLTAASFRGANLHRANLGRVEGEDVILAEATLTNAILEKADLWMANLTGAKLMGSNLRDANLNQANLTGADLSGADLIRVRMTGVNLSAATLYGAQIYGLSAWDVRTDSATKQRNLSIAPPGRQNRIAVDDIEVAQFINLLVDHAKLRKVITAVANRAVLILGRFTEPARKAFLDALANAARARGLLPIIYDFEAPPEQDWTETVLTLASLSLFVIADITKPVSIPLELQASVPNCMVPFVPVHKKGEPAFSMFKNLQTKYDWVLPVIRYDSEDQLVAAFDDAIRGPALEVRQRLIQRKAANVAEVDLDTILRNTSPPPQS